MSKQDAWKHLAAEIAKKEKQVIKSDTVSAEEQKPIKPQVKKPRKNSK